MYKKTIYFVITFLLLLTTTFQLSADNRTENIELFLVIDKSKSMVEEISDVTSYINEAFIEEFLIPGDRLVLIQFFGKAELIFDSVITDESKKSVMNDIAAIPADGRFTDIGNALDKLDEIARNGRKKNDRKYLILLTDGKQEAPPESPYYTKDGSFNHKFLENTKTIQRNGWKIMILGIGLDTAVEELAEELATTHEVMDFSENMPEPKSPSEIIGRILSEDFKIEDGRLYLTLSSEGYTAERIINIEQITFQHHSGNYDLLDKAVSFSIKPDSTKNIDFTLSEDKLKEIIDDGISGSIIFKFSGDTPFLPAVFEPVHLGIAKDENFDTNKKF